MNAEHVKALITAAHRALAVLEDEAERRGSNDEVYEFRAAPAAEELAEALTPFITP